ncbi:preprotein translocase subunit SecY [Parafannyhessea umbonata]|uniref:Protein translocase subunit SecY n=2 Tax=Parafannyhessea umbonata TaxID=604330 RepID=A0A6N7WV88_9ACTN|nr:preprotein translocase subunit SecY [Parafannyhessea umbonata]MCI6681212.1 preprotein translocase subunit SecY [Parafannyhessea umbonata]MDD6359533.1 preprotein translocase subunit SecY [Parafannyhessea umbonata]MDD6601694.1 preprotein translocase subunit SecY [Parafannyhessea umbonata]MDY4418425.1 preprotein translocase subunit SecY [Parafannyhessea umbonata]MEE1210784.1 preprotein translocase subunit SecY [Parafannyhessea umbonata]
MLKGIANAFRIPELRKKILITIGILALYRFGAYLPAPGVPFASMLEAFQTAAAGSGAIAVLNLFSGGALSRVSVFSLGIMPYITAQIILQMFQAVIPSLGELAKEGESGQRKITQYTRYLTIGLALINAIGYLFLFKSYGIDFSQLGFPEFIEDIVIVGVLLTGAIIIMWLGEVITQRGIGNGMSLIIFANIMAGLPSALISSVKTSSTGAVVTLVTVLVMIAIIPVIVYIERGQRRIPVQYAKRVVGRRIMGGQSTYLPIKVNTAGVVPIIFASALLYLPAQLAVFFPNVGWIQFVANALASGWVNWVLSVLLIVFFAYFYTSMVFNPDETADQLRKAGGFIPGVRPGNATAEYIKSVLDHITLPGALFMAVLAVVPSILFSITGNTLMQSFGGTSVLIMVGVAMDTISQLESQLKMHNYEGFFK